MKKQLLCMALAVCMLVALLPFDAAAADTPPAGYEGYTVIRDYFDLYDISSDMTGKYVLVADIDLTNALAPGGDLYSADGWGALGYSADENRRISFTGILDGNGHSIRGLRSNGAGSGLIWENWGTIKNLTIASGKIQGAGVLTGAFTRSNFGTIENCHNYASVSVTSPSSDYVLVGGITGNNRDSGVINMSSNHGDVTLVNTAKSGFTNACGGIAGVNHGTIDRVWNTGHIQIKSACACNKSRSAVAGGVVGYVYTSTSDSPGKLSNAYNTGTVSAENTNTGSGCAAEAGGIIGSFLPAYKQNAISACYNVGSVTAKAAYGTENAFAGGICGYSNDKVGNITYCYFLNNIDNGVGNRTDDSCKSLSAGLMRRANSFVGFNFSSVWSMGTEDYLYPVLGEHRHILLHVDAVEETCTEDGVEEHWVCTTCHGIFADEDGRLPLEADAVVRKAGHKYADKVVEPTCTKQGYTVHICERCGTQYIDAYVASLGHDLVSEPGIEPTCTESGRTSGTHCSRCNYVETTAKVIPALGHDYDAVITLPTCTEQGHTTHTCSRCGDSYVDSYVDAAGHKTEVHNARGASCTKPGYSGDEICSVCGILVHQGKIIPATGHTPELRDAKAATCTETGYTGDTYCSACGELIGRGQTIPALGHDYKTVITARTCTEKGYTTHTCTRCGDSYVDSYVDAPGHTIKLHGAKDATCTKDGYTGDEVCTTCHEIVEIGKVIPALGHDYTAVVTEPTCTEAGYTTYTCSRCGDSYVGDEVSALGHDWGEWEVVTEPTQFEPGLKQRVCKHDPAHIETEEIPATRVCDGGESCPSRKFVDVDHSPNCWYHAPVDWAVVNGITAGINDDHFDPNGKCTRSQAVTFLWRAMGKPEPTSTDNPFSDVSESAWYYQPVLWAVENNITFGVGGGRFDPDGTCNRSQIVTFLWRAMGKPDPTSTDNPFSDVSESAWYYQPVLWAVENGITAGVGGGRFDPDGTCIRSQIVTFLYRCMK